MLLKQQGISPEAFLRKHWQREVCFFPANVDADFQPPISAETLAGLALEPEVESRLITARNDTWQLRHGPFSPEDFDQTGAWTLLVQGVDQLLPEVDALWEWASFIPQWRRDDIMVSYATRGGGVGPHFDRYDVFLLQGAGSRTWHIGQRCDESTALRNDSELLLLSEFQTQQSLHCKSGDVLYIPPGVAHWGTANDDECMTYSLGFRAPALQDLTSAVLEQAQALLSPDQLLADPAREPMRQIGELEANDIANARAQVLKAVEAALASPNWLGESITQSELTLSADDLEADETEIELSSAHALVLDPAARVAWTMANDTLLLFSNGYTLACSPAVIPCLQDLLTKREIGGEALVSALGNPHTMSVLRGLVKTRSLYVA